MVCQRGVSQLAMLEALEPLTSDLPWEDPGAGVRYSVDNRLYGHGDGVITAAMRGVL